MATTALDARNPVEWPQIDSTRDGFGRAKLGMYFKKNWDFRNAWIGFRAHASTKNSETLILPKKINHYQRVFQDSFNDWKPEIWSKGQPWGRFHPDNVHQFYGDPQVFVGNGCLHLLNEPNPVPIVIAEGSEPIFGDYIHTEEWGIIPVGERKDGTLVCSPEGQRIDDVGFIRVFARICPTEGKLKAVVYKKGAV